MAQQGTSGMFSAVMANLTPAHLSAYEGAGVTNGILDATFDPAESTSGFSSGMYEYDPAADASLGSWLDWDTRIIELGGSDQSVFDLGTPSRRWRNIYTETGVDVLSDGTRKRFIRDCELGVGFLMRLRPVSFSWKRGASGTFHGFIGQEVAEATKGLPFSGVAESDGTYSLRYTELFAPLVKAVQEQQATITSLKDELAVLRSKLDILAAAIG